jgi:phosphoglycolate phosphatase
MPSAAQPLAGAVIAFDLDGTLVDSAPDLVGTLNHLLGEEGIAPLPFDQGRSLIGHGARRLIQRGFEAQGLAVEGADLEALFERFIAHYNLRSADLTRPFPGVPESLEALRAAGARLAVCTNKLTRLSLPILDALDLSRHFDAVIGADLRRALMVGDAGTDAGAARAAGTPLVLVSFGYTEVPVRELGPDRLIDHFDELVPACLELLPLR